MPERIPIYTTGGWPGHSSQFCRGIGCMWETGYVTVLHAPDQADYTRALFRLTAAAAVDLAEELLRCAKWAREQATPNEATEPQEQS